MLQLWFLRLRFTDLFWGHGEGQIMSVSRAEISSGAFTSCGKLGHETMTTKNSIVVEAFLRLFVETIGHYSEYLCIQQDGEKVFQVITQSGCRWNRIAYVCVPSVEH